MIRRDFLTISALSAASHLFADSFSLDYIMGSKVNSSENQIRRFVDEYKKKVLPFLLYGDMELQRSIRKIAEPLFQTSNKDYEWDIFVVQDNEKEITACTYGAGLIVFNKTFLKLCENETQLASVIAHEIGHNHYNHQVTKRELMKVYNAFEIKKLNKDLHYLNKSFSRQREREADSFVIKAFLETDYNIKEASVMFRMFEKMFGTSADMNTCLYSTHPQHKDRINHLDAVASTYSQLKYKTKDSEAFEYIKNWSRT